MGIKLSNFIVVTLFITICSPLNAEPGSVGPEIALERGIAAVRINDRKKAIHYLLPLAQRGNAEAMYYLGALFVEASDIPGHLDKAERLLTESNKRGFFRSKLLLERVSKQQQINDGTYDPPRKIAGFKTPTKHEIELINQRAERRLKNLKQRVSKPKQKPEISVFVFVEKPDSNLDSVLHQHSQIKTLHQEKVEFHYHILVQDFTPFGDLHKQSSNHVIPSSGFIPDVNGEIAKKYGVSSYPSVVIVKSGSDYEITTPALLSKKIQYKIRKGSYK